MKLVLSLAVLVAAVVLPASAGTTPASCSASPNPVQSLPYPQPYYTTVTTVGAASNTWYYIWVSEKGNSQIVQQHASGAFLTDASGTGSYDIYGTDPNHILVPGTIDVKITGYPSGPRLTTCSFQVL